MTDPPKRKPTTMASQRIFNALCKSLTGNDAPSGVVVLLREEDVSISIRTPGGGSRLRITVPPIFERRAELLKERKDLHFETVSDVYRVAMHVGMAVLEGGQLTHGVLGAAHDLHELAAEHASHLQFISQLDDLTKVIHSYLQMGQRELAQDMVYAALETTKAMPESLREMYSRVIVQRFEPMMALQGRDIPTGVGEPALQLPSPPDLVGKPAQSAQDLQDVLKTFDEPDAWEDE